ncbi:MAG TPA: GAF domain-containing SpoIIE family protein phosphatase [Jatrophihabitantaceae bacterium]|nr:GAF domain-containing SpoIIE family protein phosphatase [Jatrophihabitantaceae bacterium]
MEPDHGLARIRRVTAELAAALDLESVIETVVAHAADALGASVATLSLLTDPTTVTLVGIRGGQPETMAKWATYSLDDLVPACEALRSRRVVAVEGSAEIETRYPALAGQVPGDRSLLCLPLLAGAERVGVIGLTFEGRHTPDERQRDFLEVFAETCAQALIRVRAVAAASDRSAKLAFLSDASVELASSLDYRATLAKVAHLVVQSLGDWCAVDIVDDGTLHTLAVAHIDPAKVSWAREMQQRYPTDLDAQTGVAQVVRTGVSELYPQITDEMLVEGARDEEHLQLARDLGLRSAMVVPLAARGRVLGAISILSAESERGYGPEDLAIAEDLARRAAIAIDNAELFSETRQVALRLQHAVLPESLPTMAGWQFALHYSPAGRTDVGGDFYDVLPQSDGTVAVIVGDVMGRGVVAAAAMAQIRAAVRAYVAVDADPQSVAARLDQMFLRYGYQQLVTMVYAVIDPRTNRVTVTAAGHPAPITITSDGVAAPLSDAVDPPLGVHRPQRRSVGVEVPPDTTLLLYTDGLIERRTEDIDQSLERLHDNARALAGDDLPRALDAMVDVVRDPDRDDDVTALAIRWAAPQ